MLFFLVFILLVGIIFFVIAKSNKKPHSSSMVYNSSYPYDDDYSSSIHKPKINAEVSEDFYNAIQEYCQSNSMTISALIRKAVESYINFDSTSSDITFLGSTSIKSSPRKSSDYWRCPLCGKLNANYVGTCACGGTKDSPPKPIPKRPSYVRKDGSWKCPKCGTINAAYVGSCSCGQNKDS